MKTDNQACSWVLSQLQAERGGASVRENPWSSLHWWLHQEEMLRSGLWSDCRYAACAWGGARCKSQCLRVDEIGQWPPLDCHHSHHPQEWQATTVQGKRYFPSHEEAEYTAFLSFAIAVAASWWAVLPSCTCCACPSLSAQAGGNTGWTSTPEP